MVPIAEAGVDFQAGEEEALVVSVAAVSGAEERAVAGEIKV